MARTPSPCIDVCKYRRGDHCIACSMTRGQKGAFKALKKDRHKRDFVRLVMAQQAVMGKFGAWPDAYAKRCRKRGVPVPTLSDA